MYIDFLFYTTNGAVIVDEPTFSLFEKRARYLVDYHTQGRVKAYKNVPSDVMDCMVQLIDEMYSHSISNQISSYSNDGVSVSYEKQEDTQIRQERIIEQYLSDELLYRGVNVR